MPRLAVLMATAMVLLACGEAEETIDEVGVWSVTGEGITAVATYSDDGSYNIAPVVDGAPLPGFDMGTYEVQGTVLTYTSNAAAMGCEEGDEGRYEIEIDGPDSWTLVLIDDPCEKRAEGGPFAHTPTD